MDPLLDQLFIEEEHPIQDEDDLLIAQIDAGYYSNAKAEPPAHRPATPDQQRIFTELVDKLNYRRRVKAFHSSANWFELASFDDAEKKILFLRSKLDPSYKFKKLVVTTCRRAGVRNIRMRDLEGKTTQELKTILAEAKALLRKN